MLNRPETEALCKKIVRQMGARNLFRRSSPLSTIWQNKFPRSKNFERHTLERKIILSSSSLSKYGAGIMHIHFERVGGFAGIRLKADIDTDTLAPEEAKSLRALVEKAQLAELRQGSSVKSQRTDAFEYWLTVEDGGKEHSLRITEETIPPSARPLLDQLVAFTKRKKT